ncbi:pullulanase 1, chloroplastic isoform X5 [Ziziphus jujuba]|uniref:Pullulanase 1, chloroplastic isoform X5 n=1 Tax=Ziziphus jujuba TaxID=326968 RepID=A0ABM4AF62_ZIZJJ|nr:pullulanase 1, chloroplastic isoform X5 [Ziziphus jujuba]
MSSEASPSTSLVLPFASPKTACCIQERTVSVNPLLHGMWMLEMIAAAYLLVKALLCHLLMMVFKVIEKFPRIWDYQAFTLPPSLDVKPPVKCQLSVSTFYPDVSAVAWFWTNCSRIMAPLVHFTQTNLCRFSSGRLLLKKYGLTFLKMCQQIIPKKLSSWRRIMVFGKLKGKKITDSHHAQGTLFENLGSDTLKLEGWDELADQKPDVLSFLDISVYELHIRDFNASDRAMETKFPGGYLTFTMQFQRSDSGCNTWWIFIWPSSSARICDCSIFQPNGHNQDTAAEKLMLAVSKDHIQVGMAANLRDFVLTDYEGRR